MPELGIDRNRPALHLDHALRDRETQAGAALLAGVRIIDLLKFLDGKIAKWWMPDDVQFIDAIPHGATGKILKTALRKHFEGYKLPTA